jgi:hypothetical protein
MRPTSCSNGLWPCYRSHDPSLPRSRKRHIRQVVAASSIRDCTVYRCTVCRATFADHARAPKSLQSFEPFTNAVPTRTIYGDEIAANGSADWSVQRSVPGYSSGYGHCTFTPQELTDAFFDLVVWGEYWVKPRP